MVPIKSMSHFLSSCKIVSSSGPKKGRRGAQLQKSFLGCDFVRRHTDLRSASTKVITSGGMHSSPGELLKKNLFTSGRLLLSGRFKPGCLTRSKETFFQHHEGCGKLFIHTAFTVEDHFNFLFLFTNVVHKWRL